MDYLAICLDAPLQPDQSIFSALYYVMDRIVCGEENNENLFTLYYSEFLAYLMSAMPLEVIRYFSPFAADHIASIQEQILKDG